MPSNHILINNVIECFAPDSKIEELIRWQNKTPLAGVAGYGFANDLWERAKL